MTLSTLKSISMSGAELKRGKTLFDGSWKIKNNIIYKRMCFTATASYARSPL